MTSAVPLPITSSRCGAGRSIVLGCTHYLLVPLLRQLLPDAVQLVDPAIGVARQLDAVLGSPGASQTDQLQLETIAST